MNRSEVTNSAVSDLSYGDAIAELERIVNDLDQGTVDVDTLSEQFQRAIDIVEELDNRISKARNKVDQLMPRLNEIGTRGATSSVDAGSVAEGKD